LSSNILSMRYIPLFYYQKPDGSVIYTCEDDDTIYQETMSDIYSYEGYQKININWYIDKQVTPTIAILKEFKNTYRRWCKEIAQHVFTTKDKKKFRIQMTNYHSVNDAIISLVRSFSGINDLKGLMEAPSKDEFNIIEDECYTAGIMSLNPDYKETTQNIYGYDFSSEYPNCLVNMTIPTKTGTKTVVTELNFDKLQFGIYRVRILYTNQQLPLIFSFSKSHHYTSRQLKELYKHRELFGITFELLKVDQKYDYNAFVYGNEFTRMDTVFKKWLESMKTVKQQCSKDNKLSKMLISSVWGCISEARKIKIKLFSPEVDDYMDPDEYYSKGPRRNTDHEIFIDYNNPTKFDGMYRLKLFLTTSVRTYMFNFAIRNKILDYIVRIHTDSFMLTQKVEFDLKLNKNVVPTPEAKSTGLINISSLNIYKHVCETCKKDHPFCNFEAHECI
jgi:hypothetical protein